MANVDPYNADLKAAIAASVLSAALHARQMKAGCEPQTPRPVEVATETEHKWECALCTFINPSLYLACKMCNGSKGSTVPV